MEAENPKTGRPSDYNEDIAAEICAQLAEGKSLRTVCEAEDMPSKTSVFRWLAAHSDFRDQYARAKVESADAMAEDMLGLADEAPNVILGIDRSDGARVQAVKLQIDTRKWLASKQQPKKYGDRLEVVPPGSEALTPEAEAILSRVLSGEYTSSSTAD